MENDEVEKLAHLAQLEIRAQRLGMEVKASSLVMAEMMIANEEGKREVLANLERENQISWDNALCAFSASSNPTLKPLADLLRSEQPIPQGIRSLLAEMMDPDSDGPIWVKLVLKDKDHDRSKLLAMHKKQAVSADYANAMKQCEGKSEAVAADVGKKYGIKKDAVYKWIREAKSFHDRLMRKQ
jgi:hypothetical protein